MGKFANKTAWSLIVDAGWIRTYQSHSFVLIAILRASVTSVVIFSPPIDGCTPRLTSGHIKIDESTRHRQTAVIFYRTWAVEYLFSAIAFR